MNGTERTNSPNNNLFAVPDHELLRRIGDGSYGEVWLARGLTGALRAVKIVREGSFDNSRPYEREFSGLLHFEPISRGHDGLVDILQVGRSGPDNGFYCVMELADNATPPSVAAARNEPEWMSYQPLTLDVLIRQRGGRLPARDCIAIAMKMAEALRYLHAAGLVHRDIKPSNIIFVEGVPKLADVGLVARTNDARTLVGTEGFLAPEGPGTPPADLYSLGKCLYEMAMGKDRLQFPSPPTSLDTLPDFEELLELNEIITRACERDPATRYQSADALLSDLRIVGAGRSLRAAQARRRWFRAVCWSVVAVLAGATCWLAISTSRKGLRPLAVAPPHLAEPAPTNALRVVRKLDMPAGWPASTAKPGDYDGDGEPDLFYGNEGVVRVVPARGEAVKLEVPGFEGVYFQLQAVLNLNEKLGDEVVSSWAKGTNVTLSVCEMRMGGLHEIAHFSAQGSMYQTTNGWKADSDLCFWGIIPAPGSTNRWLLAALRSGYSLQPRSLRCYDFATSSVVWDCPLPGWVAGVRFMDALGDQPPQLLVGTYSPHNGQSEAEKDDHHSYLLALSLTNGQPLWSITSGGPFVRTIPQVASVAGSTAVHVLAGRSPDPLVRAKEDLRPEGRLLRLTPKGARLALHELPATLWSHAVVDLRRCGRVAVLATDSQGLLHEYDPEDLHQVQEVRVFPPPSQTNRWVDLSIETVADINGDGRNEIVMRAAEVEFIAGINQGHAEEECNRRLSHHNSVLVYDEQLNEVGRYKATPEYTAAGNFQVAVLPPRPNGRRLIAVFTDQAVFLELSSPPLPGR